MNQSTNLDKDITALKTGEIDFSEFRRRQQQRQEEWHVDLTGDDAQDATNAPPADA